MKAAKITLKSISLCSLLFLFAMDLFAGVSTTFSSALEVDGVIILEAEALIEKAQEDKRLLLIDSRNPADRRLGYIEDSINLPDTQTDCETLAKVAGQLDRPLVFYCNGAKCERSARALKIAKNCGYENLYWFKGGYEEWRVKHYPVLKK